MNYCCNAVRLLVALLVVQRRPLFGRGQGRSGHGATIAAKRTLRRSSHQLAAARQIGLRDFGQTSGENKNAPRERFSMFTSSRRRDTIAAPIGLQVLQSCRAKKDLPGLRLMTMSCLMSA
ncbi:MAG: hypothetical protein WBF58_03380 [Xanthobacteraceae bacterium]